MSKVLIAATAIGGCSDTSLTPSETDSVAALLQGQDLERYTIAITDQHAMDDDLIDMAASIPGFGGFYWDDGVPTVWMKDGALVRRELIVNALQARGQLHTPISPSDLAIKRARYDFIELSYWRTLIPRIASQQAITAMDVDDRTNEVFVGVAELPDTVLIRLRLDTNGVPRDAIRFGEFRFGGFDQQTVQDYTNNPRGGFRIAWDLPGPGGYGCTIGANGQHKITGAFYFITASHCSERMGVLEFTEQWQPGPYVGIIGEEFAEEPWYYGPHPNHPSGGYPCNYAQGCKAADAAYYAYNFARLPDLRLARPELNSINLAFPEYWWQAGLSGARNGSVGSPVTMVGSQSGRRNGYIVARCIDIGVNDFTDPSNPPRMLRCFDLASYASASGDSGAPVLLGSSPEIYSEYGVYGVHSGRWLYQGSLRAGYTPAINIRNLLGPITQNLYYCYTLAC